jgi:hypothetical protein
MTDSTDFSPYSEMIMIDKTQEKQYVSEYLADETKLYQDWYNAFYPPEGDTETDKFDPPFSLGTLKKRFKQWFEKRREILRHKICDEWEYPKKKGTFENKQALIIALSIDCLAIVLSLPTTNVLTVSTILVVDGYLDKLCPDSSQELPKE